MRELKLELAALGVPFDHVIEKAELVSLLNGAKAAQSKAAQSKAAPDRRLSSTIPASIHMSVSALRDLIRAHAGRASSCSEKLDLFLLAQSLLKSKPCFVCLDQLLADVSEIVVRLVCCNAVAHRACLARWILTGVAEGKYPSKCPSCPKLLEPAFVTSQILLPSQLQQYNHIVAGLMSLQQSIPASANSNSSFSPPSSLNLRQCPQCGSWIEKGPAMEAFGMPIAEGCDKMTCRCGQQFCFKCGAKDAQCACTGSEHGFFSHRDVLTGYPNSTIGLGGLGGLGSPLVHKRSPPMRRGPSGRSRWLDISCGLERYWARHWRRLAQR